MQLNTNNLYFEQVHYYTHQVSPILISHHPTPIYNRDSFV